MFKYFQFTTQYLSTGVKIYFGIGIVIFIGLMTAVGIREFSANKNKWAAAIWTTGFGIFVLVFLTIFTVIGAAATNEGHSGDKPTPHGYQTSLTALPMSVKSIYKNNLGYTVNFKNLQNRYSMSQTNQLYNFSSSPQLNKIYVDSTTPHSYKLTLLYDPDVKTAKAYYVYPKFSSDFDFNGYKYKNADEFFNRFNYGRFQRHILIELPIASKTTKDSLVYQAPDN